MAKTPNAESLCELSQLLRLIGKQAGEQASHVQESLTVAKQVRNSYGPYSYGLQGVADRGKAGPK